MPTKLVIKGVEPGTPLAGAVADHFGGRLKQFHVKQQQNYALSPTAIHRSHIEWKGGRATYTNQGGQEYLTLEVDPQLLRELYVKTDVWDYALIELFVPNTYNAAQLYCYAQIITPRETILTTVSVLPWNGIASVTDDHIPLDRLINAATNGLLVRTATDAVIEAYASFIVDLRPARGLSVVTVDLYPWLYAGDERLPGLVIEWGVGAFLPSNSPTTAFNPYPPTSTATDYPSYAASYLPSYSFNRSTMHWEWGAGAQYVVSVDRPSGGFATYALTPNSSTSGNYQGVYLWGLHTQANGDPGYVGPKPTPSEVQVTVFKGVPPFEVTQYINPAATPYCRWTFRDVYPRRPGHQTPGKNVLVPVYTNTDPATRSTRLIDFYGTPRAGTVTINLSTGGAFWGKA